MDLVSVIVPVYKVEKYLTRCVNSILGQTYQNLEIILVDDGSPDNCPAICDELASQHPNIKVIHKTNGGLSSARNAGIDACTGKYISFIDSDDYVDKVFIERLYELMHKYDADLAMLKYREVSTDRVIDKIEKVKEIVYRDSDVEKAFLQLKVDSVCVGLYSRTALANHRFIVGKTSEDIPFNFEVFKSIQTFVFVPEERYFYFYNNQSLSNGPLDKNKFNYLYYRKSIYDYYCGIDKEKEVLAEALYARAAFGLQTRMALYGISDMLDEKECKKEFNSIFKKHKKAFYREKSIPINRKIISIFVFYFYGIIRTIGKIKK